MVLNYIWASFFLIAFITGLGRLIFLGDVQVFPNMVQSTFDSASTAFEISIGLTGVMTLWLGLMKVGEKAGMIDALARLVRPLFLRLFPGVPANHPANGSMLMNISANLLGLDNASTPLGLKAMAHLQELNPEKDKASDAQIMFLVLNTSGLTIIPLSIMVFRSQLGALQPSDVFVPILLTTSVSTLAGMSAVALRQGISFRDRVLFSWMFLMLCGLGLVIMVFASLPKDQVSVLSSLLGNLLLFSIIALFVLAAIRKRIPVFDTFIEGAKEGFPVAVRIIPYLVAMLVGIGVFRSCGALDFILELIRRSVELTGFNSEFVNALPTAFMKPFSGSGARGMMVDAMNTYGPDSFVGKLACTFQGSTETTFYVLAVYFGSVGIRNTRYALSYGLFADFCGIIAAIFFAWLFFS
ncbi:MAG TPA: hypothetical protein EYQ50_25475 [Verrucomicrobiales bacterium]|nr:hypothetical protein [Verrucomicrobiales bacterium]HIL69970.1 hypothetical protein [Verrucomicrobiota bacterium]